MAEYYLTSPFNEEEIRKLKIGDTVYISGNAFTCRSRLQRYIFDEKNELPFSTDERNLLIHNGPIVIKEDGKWRLVSFMPTSSIRFEKWGAKSVENWGLRMIVGKTTMGKETAEMMKKCGCVHVSPRSVSPNLWIDSITVEDVYLFEFDRGWDPSMKGKILGTEGYTWSDNRCTWNVFDVFYSSFPRNCAIAEVAWSNPKPRDYAGFYERMKTHVKRLRAMGVP